MKLTYRIDRIPPRDRARFLHFGKRDGNLITIDAVELFVPMPAKCCRCDGSHSVENCPIPADTTPEKERAKAKQGGCCGEPSQSVTG